MCHVNPARDIAAAAGPAPAMARFPHGFVGEPALADLLRDPIAEALMVADHVRHRDLDALLETARRHLGRRGMPPAAR